MDKQSENNKHFPHLSKREFVKIVLSDIGKADKLRWALVILVMLILAASTYLMPIVQKMSMEEVLTGHLSPSTIGAFISLEVIVIASTITRSFCSVRINLSVQKNLQLKMFVNGVSRSDMTDLRRGASGYISHVLGDAEQTGTLLATNVFENALIQAVLFIAVVVTGSFWTWIFPASILPAVAIAICIWVFTAKRSNAAFKVFREEVVSVNPAILELLEGRQTILGYQGVLPAFKELEKKFDTRNSAHRKTMAWTALGNATTEMVHLISTVTFFVLALHELQSGRLSIPVLIASLAFLSAALAPLSAFKTTVDSFSRIDVLRDRMEDALHPASETALPDSAVIKLSEAKIPFLNEEQGKPLTWTLDKPYCVVGGSGAGKTSLLQVILGNRQPISGACTWGKSVSAVDIPAEVRFKSVRYLPQTIDIFNRSAAFNIRFNRRSTSAAEREEIFADAHQFFKNTLHEGRKLDATSAKRFAAVGISAELAFNAAKTLDQGASDALTKYLAGLYTDSITFDADKYARLFEQLNIAAFGERDLGPGGKEISGGERQRIGMARFLLPTYGMGFIIDEPFTSLDALTKKICVETLIAECPQTPGLIVTHDINLVRTLGFDVLFVDNDGCFTSGSLKQLCNMQPELEQIVKAFDGV